MRKRSRKPSANLRRVVARKPRRLADEPEQPFEERELEFSGIMAQTPQIRGQNP
jgi:hypothetical protein